MRGVSPSIKKGVAPLNPTGQMNISILISSIILISTVHPHHIITPVPTARRFHRAMTPPSAARYSQIPAPAALAPDDSSPPLHSTVGPPPSTPRHLAIPRCCRDATTRPAPSLPCLLATPRRCPSHRTPNRRAFIISAALFEPSWLCTTGGKQMQMMELCAFLGHVGSTSPLLSLAGFELLGRH